MAQLFSRRAWNPSYLRAFRRAFSKVSNDDLYHMTSTEAFIYQKKDKNGQMLKAVPMGEKSKVKAKILMVRSNIYMLIVLCGAGWYIYRGKTFKDRGELDLPNRVIHKHELLDEKNK